MIPRRQRSLVVDLLLSVLVLSALATQIPSSVADELRALETLGELSVKGRAPLTGYARDLFGSPWSDVDRNGCDTRNDILKRDLEIKVFLDDRDQCTLKEGVLIDPYSGERIEFVRGRVSSLAVQIDHVVSLSNAWQTGAFRWRNEKRLAFANDPLNLLAVKGSLNAQKGDGDAATWLPPKKSYRCAYVARQIAVKQEYRLWVTKSERDAMQRVLSKCRNQSIPRR